MSNYTCEESVSCTNFQSAICLHCNLRLCTVHISEHDRIVFSGVKNLSDEVEITVQQIREGLEKNKDTRTRLLNAVDEWRAKQVRAIEQVYTQQVLSVESAHHDLTAMQVNLLEQLERDARHPLDRIQQQNNASSDILQSIRQTMERIRNESARLNANFSSVGTEEYEAQASRSSKNGTSRLYLSSSVFFISRPLQVKATNQPVRNEFQKVRSSSHIRTVHSDDSSNCSVTRERSNRARETFMPTSK